MGSSLFLRKWACRRMAANGLGIILFRYADWLHAKGYSRNTIHLYTQAVEHFGFWRAKHRPGSQNVQPSEVAEFLHSHSWRCSVAGTSRRNRPKMRDRLGRWLLILINTWRRFADSVRRPGSIGGAM